jgi:hypothetical protein
MFQALKRLILAILEVGIYQFLRRVGWQWAIGVLLAVAAVLLIVIVTLAFVIGILL